MADILNIEDGVLKKCTDKSVTSVVIPEGVTAIGKHAFWGCKSLSSVVIPESVTEIGVSAFEGCSSLSSVEIPAGVTEIGFMAFCGCSSLSSVVIGEGVTAIDGWAFSGCESLESVVIPEGITEICEYAFRGCESLSSVAIPSSVRKIGRTAFDGCESLSSVVIPEEVTKIGEETFKGCTSLESVVIPDSVTKIGRTAFDGCESLSSVVIPEGVTEIGEEAFCGCKSLASVAIPSSVTEIGESAFRGCKSLAKVTLGDDFKKVPSEWFDSLNEANANYEILCTEGSSTYKAIKRSSKLKTHIKTLALQSAKDKKIAEVQKAGVDAVLPMLLEGVADSSFEIMSNTKSATVALVRIGRNTGVFKLGADSSKWLQKLQKTLEAFSDSSKSGEDIFGVIKEQKMPLGEIPAKKAGNTTLKADSSGGLNLFALGALRKMKYDGMKDIGLFGITEIGGHAFENCKSLSSVEFGGTVAQWEAVKGKLYLLEDNPATSVKCADGEWQKPVVLLEDGVVMKCFDKGMTSVVIPEGVTAIRNMAFYGCESLSSVVIPPSVTEIGSHAFYGCKSLETMEFGGTAAQWEAVEKGDGWNGNASAKTVKCADGEWQKPVLLVEDGVAVECLDKSTASVVIPEGVTTIGAYAFKGCKSLSSVVIPPSVTEIGDYAFLDCDSLASVVIPSSVTAIGRGAFYWCKSLTSVEIPSSVTAIDEWAFEGCTSLSSVEFGGTVAQWKAMKKGAKWHDDVPATSVKCSDGEAEL